MQAPQIREGQCYAVSIVARKGVKPEDLHKIKGVQKMLVLSKGADRFADTAMDEDGEYGTWKQDGIRAIKDSWIDSDPEIQQSCATTLKPRDFLMPWREYEQRVEQDSAEAAELQRKIEEHARLRKEAQEALTLRLVSMGLKRAEYYDLGRADYCIVGDEVRMSLKTMDELLDSISTRVYELLSSAE